jgi:hypothetical protein
MPDISSGKKIMPDISSGKKIMPGIQLSAEFQLDAGPRIWA